MQFCCFDAVIHLLYRFRLAQLVCQCGHFCQQRGDISKQTQMLVAFHGRTDHKQKIALAMVIGTPFYALFKSCKRNTGLADGLAFGVRNGNAAIQSRGGDILAGINCTAICAFILQAAVFLLQLYQLANGFELVCCLTVNTDCLGGKYFFEPHNQTPFLIICRAEYRLTSFMLLS